MSTAEIKQAVAVELQSCIATIGPIPDVSGHPVKLILASDNPHDLITLGATLEYCRAKRSYDRLVRQYDPNREDAT